MNRLKHNISDTTDTGPPDLPAWLNFPGEEWESITPSEAGLDTKKFEVWVSMQDPKFGVEVSGQRPDNGGAVMTRGGYLIQVWGDSEFEHQSASLGKNCTRMALQLAVDHRLIASAHDVIYKYWSGENEIAPHKILNRDHHRLLTL